MIKITESLSVVSRVLYALVQLFSCASAATVTQIVYAVERNNWINQMYYTPDVSDTNPMDFIVE